MTSGGDELAGKVAIVTGAAGEIGRIGCVVVWRTLDHN